MKKLSLFFLTCLLSTSWAWAEDVILTETFSCVASQGVSDKSWQGDLCGWSSTQTRWKTDSITVGSKKYRAALLALTTSGTGQLETTDLEGGIKAVSFYYARSGSNNVTGNSMQLKVSAGAIDDYTTSYSKNELTTSSSETYNHTFNCKTNGQLVIKNNSTETQTKASGTLYSKILVYQVKITPYLLYRQKVVTIGSKQQGYYNAELINNTGSEGTVTYSSSNESVAKVDRETGVITPVDAGTTTITATWNEGASTTYTLHVVNGVFVENFSKVQQTSAANDSTWDGDLFDWTAKYCRRGANDTIGLNPRKQATWLAYSGTASSLASANPIEGGVKHLKFTWKEWSVGKNTTTKITVTYGGEEKTAATKVQEATVSLTSQTYDVDIDGISNAVLKLENASFVTSTGVVTNNRVVIENIQITPYLLYTTKSHTLDTGEDNLTYTNAGLIKNTSGEAVVYSIAPSDAGASINSSTGAVTVTDKTKGDFIVTATWGAVSTTYTLTVLSRVATTASYDEATKRVGLDVLAIVNPLTYTDGYDGTITYTSSNTDVATVADNGTVSLAGGVGQTTITATLSQTENYKAATASFTLYVRDNNARIENFSNIPVGGGIIGDAGTDWEGVYFNWRAEGAIRRNASDTIWGTNNPDNVKVWIATKASTSSVTKTGVLSSKEAIEGGIKHLSFYWKQWASESNRILRIAAFSGETRKGFMEYTPNGASTHEKFLFGANDVMRGNQILSIKNESYTNGTFDGTIADDGNACKSRIIIDTIYITPYLLYTNKAEQSMRIGETYKRLPNINNTGGTPTYTSSDPAIASVAADGTVTAIARGKVTITAKYQWNESEYVTTTYPVAVYPVNCETFDGIAQTGNYSNTTPREGDKATWTTSLGGFNVGDCAALTTNLVRFRAPQNAEEEAYIYSSAISGGISTLTFDWNLGGGESTTEWDIRIYINEFLVYTLDNTDIDESGAMADHFKQITITNINDPRPFVIRFENHSTIGGTYPSGNRARFLIDNIVWEGYAASSIDLDEEADNSDILTLHSGISVDVNTNRSLVANVWNTLCLPFAVSKSTDLDNAEVQELSACTADGDALTVSFTAVTSDALVPGKPYLVKPTSNIPLTGFTDKQITIIPQAVNVGVITFQGIFSPATLTGGDMNTLFVGTPNAAGNNLFYPSTTSQLKGMRAYFKINTGSGAPLFRTARFVVEEKKLPTAVDDARGQEVTVEKLIEDGHVIIIRDGKRYNVLGAQE